MNTRRYPRTLEQAFGPYARGHIQEPQEPMPRVDRIVIGVCLVGAAAFLLMMAAGWVQ